MSFTENLKKRSAATEEVAIPSSMIIYPGQNSDSGADARNNLKKVVDIVAKQLGPEYNSTGAAEDLTQDWLWGEKLVEATGLPARVVIAFSAEQASFIELESVANAQLPEGMSETLVEGAVRELADKLNSRIVRPGLRFWLFSPDWADDKCVVNDRRLDPTLWWLGENQKTQQKNFKEFSKKFLTDHPDADLHSNVQNEYLTAVIGDYAAGIDYKSDEFVLNWGWARTDIKVPYGGSSRWLFVNSGDGQPGVHWIYGYVCWFNGRVLSVGRKA